MQGQPDLLEVIGAFAPRGRFANLLHGRQQQADQDGDNGDDDQQLDQCECAADPHDVAPVRLYEYPLR